MRILLDENIDRLVKTHFDPIHEVFTVRERDWAGKKNGELLRLAQHRFDAFVTMDTNLEYQQNLKGLDLAIIVLKAPSNAYSVVSPLIAEVNLRLKSLQAKDLIHVGG